MSCHPKKQVDIQGHRGCRGLLPENSLPAFEKAIDLGVHTLELDIIISKDLKVVVSHEPSVNPEICQLSDKRIADDATEQPLNLFEMTYERIKTFDCGSKYIERFPEQKKLPTYKPLLSEVFELTKSKNSEVRFNIELKTEPGYDYGIYTPDPKAYTNIVLEEIERYNMFTRVNLQSFDLAILEEIKKQAPSMPVALLVDENETIKNKLGALSFKPEIISPYFKLLSKNELEAYQSQGYLVIPWTVNETVDMKTMLDWHVDGIITDYPNRLIALISK